MNRENIIIRDKFLEICDFEKSVLFQSAAVKYGISLQINASERIREICDVVDYRFPGEFNLETEGLFYGEKYDEIYDKIIVFEQNVMENFKEIKLALSSKLMTSEAIKEEYTKMQSFPKSYKVNNDCDNLDYFIRSRRRNKRMKILMKNPCLRGNFNDKVYELDSSTMFYHGPSSPEEIEAKDDVNLQAVENACRQNFLNFANKKWREMVLELDQAYEEVHLAANCPSYHTQNEEDIIVISDTEQDCEEDDKPSTSGTLSTKFVHTTGESKEALPARKRKATKPIKIEKPESSKNSRVQTVECIIISSDDESLSEVKVELIEVQDSVVDSDDEHLKELSDALDLIDQLSSRHSVVEELIDHDYEKNPKWV